MTARRVLVMGLGRFGGGLGVCRWLLAQGEQVTVTDLASAASLEATLNALTADERAAITWRLGEHVEADFAAADLVVVNPAVPPTSRFIQHARDQGAAITSEVELYLRAALTHAPRLVLITGTQGKSSTAHMIAGLIAAAGQPVTLAGNIGRSLLEGLADRAAQKPATTVIELSSYQLDALPSDTTDLAKAPVVVITNLLVDHLARHGTEAAYHRAKLRLLDLVAEGGLALLPESANLDGLLTPAQTARLASGALHIARFQDQLGASAADYRLGPETFEGPKGPLAPLSDLQLPGDYQRFNALAALAAVEALDVAPLDLKPITGLEHRSEVLGTFGEHATLVIDNGVSTTPDSTLSAILAVPAPVILLMGGQSKNMSLETLVKVARPHLARVVTFGAARDEFADAFIQAGVAVEKTRNVQAAVTLALAAATPGETLLFSPAAASFDAYTNFKARALDFRAALPPRRTPSIPL